MKAWGLRVLLMLSCFSIDVRLRAEDGTHGSSKSSPIKDVKLDVREGSGDLPSEPASLDEFFQVSRVLQHPAHCLKTGHVCNLNVTKSPFVYQSDYGHSWVFGEKAVFQLRGKKVRPLKGWFNVKALEELELNLSGLEISLQSGRVLLFKDAVKLEIYNISSEVAVSVKGKDQPRSLPKGFKISVYGIASDGSANSEIVQAINGEQLISTWAGISYDIESFKEELFQFKPVWRGAIDQASQWHRQSIERKVANHQEGLRRARERRRKLEAENKSLREMFRRKVGY